MRQQVAGWMLLLVVGCNDASAPSEGPGIAQVDITPLVTQQLLPGDTVQLTAVARGSTGEIAHGAVITWGSSNPDVIAVDSRSGRGVALLSGTARITATAENVTSAVETNVCDQVRAQKIGSRFQTTFYPGYFDLGAYPNNVSAAAVYDGQRTLFRGGLLFGNGPNAMLFPFSFDPIFALAPWYDNKAGSPLCIGELPVGTYTRALVRVRDPAALLPLRIIQETLAPRGALSEFQLFRFTFTNTGTNTIDGFRAAMALDWDLTMDSTTTPSGNFTRFDSALGAAQVYEAGMQTAGIAGIGTPITSYIAFGNSVPLRTAQDYYHALAAGISSVEFGPTDVKHLVGFGPFTIPPGKSAAITFALTAGVSREKFVQNVQLARESVGLFPMR